LSDPELPVLEALAAEPSLSQRELAQRAGLSLTRAHFVLKRLMQRGLVKVLNATQSEHKLGYLYLLTPQGLEEKASLTYAFLQRTAAEYQQMVLRVDAALEESLAQAVSDTPLAVTVLGEGPLGQVVRDLIAVRSDVRLVDDLSEAAIAIDANGDQGEVDAAAGSCGVRTVRLA
jgi:EPS-associated MarR family transcriptional regulator